MNWIDFQLKMKYCSYNIKIKGVILPWGDMSLLTVSLMIITADDDDEESQSPAWLGWQGKTYIQEARPDQTRPIIVLHEFIKNIQQIWL